MGRKSDWKGDRKRRNVKDGEADATSYCVSQSTTCLRIAAGRSLLPRSEVIDALDPLELKLQKVREKELEKIRVAESKKVEAQKKQKEAAAEKERQRKEQADIKFTANLCNKALSKSGAIRVKMEKALQDEMVTTKQIPVHLVNDATKSFKDIKKIQQLASDHVGGEALTSAEKDFLISVDEVVRTADTSCKALQEMSLACKKHAKAKQA